MRLFTFNRAHQLYCAIVVAVLFSCNQPKPPSSPPSLPKQQVPRNHTFPKTLTPEYIKKWHQGLRKDSKQGEVSTAAVKVTASDTWLDRLKLTGDKNVVVNASNKSITFGGGELNRALKNYAAYKGQK